MPLRSDRPRCPRCRGAMFFEQDQYGASWNCIACGHTADLYPNNLVVLRTPDRVAASA